ncbi:hypothetical protein L0F63_003675 [Massospora cicadina]|nr:hypothetical protein L0F63_003675 [Massospora cicadina]
MTSHVEYIGEVCTLLLLFSFAISSYRTYESLLEFFVQLPFLYDNYDSEFEGLTPTARRTQLENDVRFRVARLSSTMTLRRLTRLHQQGWVAKIFPFLRPDLRSLVDAAIQGFVSPDFQLPEPSSVLPYVKFPLAASSRLVACRLPVFTGILRTRLGYRPGGAFACPEIPHESAIENFDFCPSTVLVGHHKSVFCLSYDATGDRLITGSDDKLIKVWDIKSGGLIFTMNGHSVPVSDFHLFDDGRHLLSCDIEGYVVLWDLTYGLVKSKRRLAQGNISNIFFLPANFGKKFSLFAAGEDGRCYHLEIGLDFFFEPNLTTYSDHLYKRKRHFVACRNATGTLIAYGGEDFMIYISQPKLKLAPEDLETMEDICRPKRLNWEEPQLKAILHGHTYNIATLEFNKRGIACSRDNTARVWSFEPISETWSYIIMGEELDLDVEDGAVRTLEKGHRVRETMKTGLDHNICSVAWAANDDIILVSYDSGLLRMFCSHSGHFLRSTKLSDCPVHALAVHPTASEMALAACYSGRAAIINVRTGRQVKLWEHEDEPTFIEVKWSPKGDHFSLTTQDGRCLTYVATFGLSHTIPAISGVQQCLSSDFVNLTSSASFPIHGTETRRNEFRKYDLKTFACDTQPQEYQKPADFGIEYTQAHRYEPPCDPSTLPQLYEHLRWPSLATTFELPKKYQYQKFHREHVGLFEEREHSEDLEPIVMPKSPNDDDFVPSRVSSSHSDVDMELDSDEVLLTNGCARSPIRTRRHARQDLSPPEKRLRRGRYAAPITRSQTQIPVSESSSASDTDDEIVLESGKLRRLSNRMDLDSYPLPDGVQLSADWAKLVDQHVGTYFPQVRDPIVYLPSGHKEYASGFDNEFVLSCAPPFKKIPYLAFAERGVIQSVKFSVRAGVPLAEFRLKLDSGPVLAVMVGPHLPRFIVHQSIYDAANQQPPQLGDTVQVRGQGEFQIVANVADGEDPWNAVTLRGVTGGFGAWELHHPQPIASLDAATVGLYSRVLTQLSRDCHFDDFIDQIDLVTYPEYLNHVASPMFLALIGLRLRHGFYRSESAILQDLQLIYANARTFNETNSPIVRQAKALVARAKALIKAASPTASSQDSSSSSPAPRPYKRAQAAEPKLKRKILIASESGSASEKSVAEELPPAKRGRPSHQPTALAPRRAQRDHNIRSLRPRKAVNYFVPLVLSDSDEG